MHRIKSVEKIKMNPGNVLIKIHFRDSKIIIPNKSVDYDGPAIDYAEVVAVSSDITDLKKGDIILEFKTVYGFEYESDYYAIVHRLALNMVIGTTNFDKKRVKSKLVIKA